QIAFTTNGIQRMRILASGLFVSVNLDLGAGNNLTNNTEKITLGADAVTGHSMGANDTHVTGALEVDGTTYLDGYTIVDNNLAVTGQLIGASPETLTPSGTTQTLDFDNGNAQILDLEAASGDVTVVFANAHGGGSYIIKIIQDSASSHNIIWPATVLHPGGVVPVISAGNNAVDIVTLFYDGTNFFMNIGQDFS
ncbi:hypothetical protein LCGC14_2602040, partial [marine sediment metagenome]